MARRTESSADGGCSLRVLLRLIRERVQFPEQQKRVQSGFDLLFAGDLAAAARICTEVLAKAPEMPRAHFLAGMIALKSGDRLSAEKAFENTVRHNDTHAAAWARLAHLYVTNGRVRMAEAALLNATNCQRGNPVTLDLIGTVFRLAGNLEASLEWHEKAAGADSRNVPLLINLANAHTYLGQQKDAIRVLSRCLDIDPENAQAHWLISRTGRAGTDDHVAQLRGLAEKADSPQDRAYLNYALGKELEDLGDWDGAFEAWSEGATARHELVDWDEDRDTRLFDTLNDKYTQEWLADHRGECFDAGPIFILGQPRTGTTLLDRMLNAHPAVTSGGELRFFGFAVRQVAGIDEPLQFTPELLREASMADVTKIGEAYVDLTSSLRLDSAHIVDKLPSNYLYLPLILAALPNARVIHLRRHPLDSCLAIFKQLFADAYLYSYDLGELARHYRRYLALMATFRQRFGERYVEVSYEALVTDPEETLREVLQYAGLSWNDACLEYFRHDSGTTTASAQQVREAPHTRSVGHWKHFEQQLQPVIEILGDQID